MLTSRRRAGISRPWRQGCANGANVVSWMRCEATAAANEESHLKSIAGYAGLAGKQLWVPVGGGWGGGGWGVKSMRPAM